MELTKLIENIQKFAICYLTKENITFLLALLGSIGAVIQAFLHFLSTRKKIEIQIVDYRAVQKVIQFFIHVQNQSRSPICISSISICYDKNEIYCELIPKKIRGKEETLICTPMFPLNHAPLQGGLYFFEFINCPETSLISGKTFDFVIYTNRGPIKKSVILGEQSHYLHIEKQLHL